MVATRTPILDGVARPIPPGRSCALCRAPARVERDGRAFCTDCYVEGLPRAAPQPPGRRPTPVRTSRRPEQARSGRIVWRGACVRLSAARYRLVRYLAANPGVRRHAELIAHLWGPYDGAREHLRVLVCQTNQLAPGLIEGVPFVGYRLAADRVEGL
jgi:hypothetical protein